MLAKDFQKAKKLFFQALSVQGYGAWIGKPTEEKSFEASAETWKNRADCATVNDGSNNGSAMEFKEEEV